MFKKYGYTLVLFLCIACSSDKNTESVKVPPIHNLSITEAQERKKQIAAVDYRLSFNLDKQSLNFSGTSQIHFDYTGVGERLRVDFYQGQVISLKLNGDTVQFDYDGAAIYLETTHLNKGKNHLDIDFYHAYSKDGAGLYRYQDPADQKVYLYTNLEPFDANKVFPSFDQPNLKATYTMQVTAPQEWQVITSVKETQIDVKADKKIWQFPQSARFSTYIWSLHAGEYAVFEGPQFRYPLRLFTRASLKPYVKADDWFTFTIQGFDFFEPYFGYPYPYKKYDQVIVPDFNAGAMENVGAVTFSEYFVSRGKKTQAERLSLASVIMHEMAHMWFGNLVTMNWWDDLWLNESFASFMEPLALAANTEFKTEAWLDFFKMKRWAYWTDDQPNTHPIAVVVNDTDKAMTIFDGITYGKGSASLKQLMFKLNSKDFQKGLQYYFNTYALKNTTLDNFIDALAVASKQPLDQWRDSWLKTAGLNSITPSLVCEKGKIKTLSFSQKAPEAFPTLREHNLLVAFFKLNNNKLIKAKSIKLRLNGANTAITQVKGLVCPDAIFANYDDYGFADINIDRKSLNMMSQHFNDLDERLLKHQFTYALWRMLRAGQLSIETYIDFNLRQLPKTQDDLLLSDLLKRIHGTRANSSSVIYFLNQTDKAQHKAFVEGFSGLIWQQINQSQPDSDQQKYWFNAMVKTANSPKYLDKMAMLLSNKNPLLPMTIDQDMRWDIIEALSAQGHPKAIALATKESQKDVSLMGKQAALKAKASLPDAAIKSQLLKKAIDVKSAMSLAEKKAVFSSLYPASQLKEREAFSPEFFNLLTQFINNNRSASFIEAFIAGLAPQSCSEQSPLKAYLQKPNLPEVVKKSLTKQLYEDSRCALIKQNKG